MNESQDTTPIEDDNPFRAPEETSQQESGTAVGVRSGEMSDVYAVAKYQRWALVCIGLQLVGFAAVISLPRNQASVAALALFPVLIAGVVSVLMLAIKIYGVVQGVLVAILAVVPYLGFILLALMNGRATKIIRANGFHVGFFGASASQFATKGEGPRA